MLRWVILSVVVVVLAATATFVAQYRNGANPSWDLPPGNRARRRDLSPWPRWTVRTPTSSGRCPPRRPALTSGRSRTRERGISRSGWPVHLHVHDRQAKEAGRRRRRSSPASPPRSRWSGRPRTCGRRVHQGGDDRHQRPESSGDQAQRSRVRSSPGRDPPPASGRGHLRSATS